MENKKSKTKFIFCEICSYKKIVKNQEDIAGLVEIKTSAIPGGSPELNKISGKTDFKKTKLQNKKTKLQNKKFKCPNCGRGIILKETQTAYSTTIGFLKEKEQKEKLEIENKKRIEDGKPLIKKPSDFLG